LLSFLKEKSAKMEIFSAMLLGPFEQLEREFGWEGGTPAVPIRPPSAFCSLADIQEDAEKAADDDEDDDVSDQCKDDDLESDRLVSACDLVNEDAAGLNDSGVCDLQEVRADIRTEPR
jgi:hypothetical protein